MVMMNNNKIKIMKAKNILLTVIIGVCLISCRGNLPTSKVIDDPYIVKSIETYDRILCVYNLETGQDYPNFIDDVSVVDTIGKFTIGDTVCFVLKKQ